MIRVMDRRPAEDGGEKGTFPTPACQDALVLGPEYPDDCGGYFRRMITR